MQRRSRDAAAANRVFPALEFNSLDAVTKVVLGSDALTVAPLACVAAELERREGLHDEQAIRAHTREHIHAMQARADAVFNNFLDLVGRPQRRVVLPSREFGD